MSVREFSPLFSWGFSLRRSKWLVPLFNNNVFAFGNSAVNGPYGWNSQTRSKSSNHVTQQPSQNGQTREIHTSQQSVVPEVPPIAPILPKNSAVKPQQRPQKPSTNLENISLNNSSTVQARDNASPLPSASDKNNASPARKSKEQLKEKYGGLTDGELIDALCAGSLSHYVLEDIVEADRAVKVRRMYLASLTEQSDMFSELPYENYNYMQLKGKCCENVVGYVPVPVGMVGPILIDGKQYYIPMATTEGTLLASTSRGAKAITTSGGVSTVLLTDGMTRGPVVTLPNARRSAQLKQWLSEPENFQKVATVFNSKSSYARLKEIKCAIAGKSAYIRFKCATGDAMGMNMISIAVENSIKYLQEEFPDLEVKAVSGNFCTDKKPAAINWIEGRGKSVVCDATISKEVVESVLKTTVDELVSLNIHKNLVGSSLAGSIGGFNAHASNIVTAIFLATGQDCAQNIESSSCMTLMEKTTNGDLYISITMPSIEVGTVGGGTQLSAQSACLNMLGVKGPNKENPGENARQLARIIAGTVMAGELSLMSALAAGHLVKAHLVYNRGTNKPN